MIKTDNGYFICKKIKAKKKQVGRANVASQDRTYFEYVQVLDHELKETDRFLIVQAVFLFSHNRVGEFYFAREADIVATVNPQE